MREDWTIAEGLPPEATPERIQNALTITAHETAPASPQAFAVSILKLFNFGKAFGMLDQRTAADMTAFYRGAMSELPDDLVAKAVELTISTWKWNRMPTPADLLETIADDLERRRRTKHAMERALFQANLQARANNRPKIKLTPDQQAKFNEWLRARTRRVQHAAELESKAEAEAQLARDRAKFYEQYPEMAQ